MKLSLVLACPVLLVACSSEPASSILADDRDAYALSVERCRAGDDRAALAALRSALARDPGACQRALLEPAFAHGPRVREKILHDVQHHRSPPRRRCASSEYRPVRVVGAPCRDEARRHWTPRRISSQTLRDGEDFRSAIHAAAQEHSLSSLTLVGKDEPGERVEVEGRVVDASGAAVAGAVVRVFATDADGRYHPSIEGERLPRIFGTLVTDDGGRFRFETVLPGPYPGTRNPRHVHVSVRAGSRRLAAPGYAVFDDDPLLFEPGNEEPRDEALRIAMRTVDGRRLGRLVLPVE